MSKSPVPAPSPLHLGPQAQQLFCPTEMLNAGVGRTPETSQDLPTTLGAAETRVSGNRDFPPQWHPIQRATGCASRSEERDRTC